jgi:glutamate dehydrogenase
MNGHSVQAFPSSFVDQVSALLTPAETSTLGNLTDALHSGEKVSVATLLKTLFARATKEFIKSQSPEQAARIISGSLAAIDSLSKEPDRISLSLNPFEEGGDLFLALDDHPFIISSIAETLSDADVKVDAFLHPIFLFDGEPVAVSFIRIAEGSFERAQPLLPRLREMLHNLTRVGRDFAAMKALVTATLHKLPSTPLRGNSGEFSADEVSQFLSWLNEGCFFFLGAGTGSTERGLENTSLLGIWRAENQYTATLRTEVREDVEALAHGELQFSIRKLRLSSRIHRHATLVHILVQPQKSSPSFSSFVGYLTSKAWAHEAQDIPILRKKVDSIIAQEGVIPNSHDYKYIVEVIDNMPTDEALATPASNLVALANLALGVFSQDETRTMTSIDESGRRAFTAIVLPPERYSAAVQAVVQNLLEEAFNAEPWSSEVHIDSSKRRQFRLYITTPLPPGSKLANIPNSLSERIISATMPWDEKLQAASQSLELSFPVHGVFPNDYKAATDTPEAVHDLKALSGLTRERPSVVSLFSPEAPGVSPLLSIFSANKETSISLATPILENVGVEVLSAYSYECLGPLGTTYLLKLSIRPYDGEPLHAEAFNASVAPGLSKVLDGEAPNDPLNSLLRKVPLDIQQISLLRCYCAHLWQIQKISTKRTMWEALAGSPNVALQLCRVFDWMFNPAHDLSLEERSRKASLEESVLLEALRDVRDITQDRVLRALLALVKNTVRTNFFSQPTALALKLRSQKIEFMPHPRPLFEIFVFSSRIEGTHLRSARVARGGIRWSERLDDYRSEVLGLMKTQKVKNVIIVPSGAKGGFIVKNLPRQGDQMLKGVETGYREYITALLTLADNKANETVIHPKNMVIHDEPDPYFVVAADKGTATFSDVANSIAINDFHFWLGDAFASGGSAGYDHKKYGITAKGGWECVQRHFRDLGINYLDRPFTVVGLGDMSGDVFGNGLLLSPNMALVAAFNHKHIFIDPTPNLPAASAERLRLFTTPRSQWSDFKPEAISKGGGVFNRFDKEIKLNPEIRAALSIPDETPNVVDGEQLITCILKAKVDLIWNGGIGTYVKAGTESHADVNDGTNDGVRVNADQLRARVVGEGGNLGFTQKARVEFSLKGGRINTDAIDNSGGVDLSDHEVNLKLLLSPLVQAGSISREERDSLLKQIAPDVVESVLQHNRDQALMLSVSQLRSATTMEQYRYLIRDMHRLGFLDRGRDALPDEAEIDERAAAKIGLTRPELAICSAAIKMWVKEGLRSSNLCKDQSLERFLLEYFPHEVRSRFSPEVLAHPLRADIIASEIISSITPVVGISFIHSLVTMNTTTVPTVMKCVLAADTILGGAELRRGLRALDTSSSCEQFTALWLDMGSAVRQAANWLLATHGSTHSLQEIVGLYADQFKTLSTHSALVFTGKELQRFERRVAEYRTLRADTPTANALALYRRILPLLEMLWAAREFSRDVKIVAATYSQVLEELRINELFKLESSLEASSKWEQELIAGSYQEIRRSISLITGQVVSQGCESPESVRRAISQSPSYEAIRSTMADVEELLRQKRPFQVAALPVITRQLRLFTAKA